MKVKVKGKEVSIRVTMGALLRFNKETGKDMNDFEGMPLNEYFTFLFCCMQSASACDGLDIADITKEDLMDAIDADRMQELGLTFNAASSGIPVEKKT